MFRKKTGRDLLKHVDLKHNINSISRESERQLKKWKQKRQEKTGKLSCARQTVIGKSFESFLFSHRNRTTHFSQQNYVKEKNQVLQNSVLAKT